MELPDTDLFGELAKYTIGVGLIGVLVSVLGCVAGKTMKRCATIIFRLLIIIIALGFAYIAFNTMAVKSVIG
jgi:hypothetical protein